MFFYREYGYFSKDDDRVHENEHQMMLLLFGEAHSFIVNKRRSTKEKGSAHTGDISTNVNQQATSTPQYLRSDGVTPMDLDTLCTMLYRMQRSSSNNNWRQRTRPRDSSGKKTCFNCGAPNVMISSA